MSVRGFADLRKVIYVDDGLEGPDFLSFGRRGGLAVLQPNQPNKGSGELNALAAEHVMRR